MKITLNKSQWETIGKTAGWMDDNHDQIGYDDDYTPQPTTDRYTFSDNHVDGSVFGNPSVYYSVQLVQTQRAKDDSDFSPTGHGPLIVEDGPRETVSLVIAEFVEENGEDKVLRTSEQIQEQSPDLYNQILDYAEERAMRDGE